MTLRKLTTAAVFSPCRSAASSIDDGKGLIDSTRRSAASASPACCETADRTRSVKNVTALIAATATTRAANNTSTSPDFQSRANRRPASRHGVLITDPLLPYALGLPGGLHDTGPTTERQTASSAVFAAKSGTTDMRQMTDSDDGSSPRTHLSPKSVLR